MSVPLGKRGKSKLDIVAKAKKIYTLSESISLRKFGAYSKSSIVSKAYNRIVKRSNSSTEIDNTIDVLSINLRFYGEEVLQIINGALLIFPRDPESYNLRREYLSYALDSCMSIKRILVEVFTIFGVISGSIRELNSLIDSEISLINELMKNDRKLVKI